VSKFRTTFHISLRFHRPKIIKIGPFLTGIDAQFQRCMQMAAERESSSSSGSSDSSEAKSSTDDDTKKKEESS